MSKQEKIEGQQELFENTAGNDGEVHVMFSRLIEERNMSYQQIFEGFDHLRVITFSYGLRFVQSVVEMFEDVELILGSEKVVREDIATIAAEQRYELREISKHEKLVELIQEDRLRLWFNRQKMSHEKLYIMWADDGRTRVMVGSANFSKRAWTNEQSEQVVAFDNDDEAYESYLRRFESLKDDSTTTPFIAAALAEFRDAGDDLEKQIEATPVFNQKGLLYLVDDKDEDVEITYTFDPADMTEEEKQQYEAIREAKPRTAKMNGVVAVEPAEVRRVIRKGREGIETYKERAVAYPRFRYDVETKTAFLNEKPYRKYPGGAWQKDARAIASVFNNYDLIAVGDTEKAKRQFFEILCFMFTAPFMAKCRKVSVDNGYTRGLEVFPNYCIVYGNSNGGKTAFAEMCLKAMYGSKETGKVPRNSWTKTRIERIDAMCHGMCVMIDEVQNFNRNAGNIVKSDADMRWRQDKDWPIYILTENETKAMDKAIAKRTIPIRIEIQIPKNAGISVTKPMNDAMAELTTAFYQEYLLRMSPLVYEMNTRAKASEFKTGTVPDLLGISSKVLHAMFDEAGLEAGWNDELSYKDFNGEEVVGQYAKSRLLKALKMNPRQFKTRRDGTIEYHPKVKDAQGLRKELNNLVSELPIKVQATVVNNAIVFEDADEFEKFLGVPVGTGLISRLRRLRAES